MRWSRRIGRRVELVVLEEVAARSAGKGAVRHPDVAEAEDRWMVKLLDEGHDLLNVRRPQTHSEVASRDRDILDAAIERGREMFGEV